MRFDLHTHTTYSLHHFWGRDALNTPAEMINAAIKRGLGGIAITDHQTVKGSLVGEEYVKTHKLDFKIITGMEIRTLSGDLLALGIRENIPDGLTLETTIEKIHALNGLAVAPHPYGEFGLRECLKEKAVKADAIEVFNAGSCRSFQNLKARKLAIKNHKPFTAGSDAHYYKNVGNAGVSCEGDPIEAIRKNKITIFGMYTPIKDVAIISIKKYGRSVKHRILKNKTKIA
ncbi:MAG: PHP domain-containing protein [Nanoarchaeota archaeon]|nr:PHP domain-containing protein [Nanoarchaeota archaeon]MBU4124471.1 PHP domain-containing protein [Nanoarchaeota archaeon]